MEIVKSLRILKGNVLRNINRVRSVRSIFQSIYVNREWGDDESVSGTGSKRGQTTRIALMLPLLCREYNIKTILDIPCGDFNWMRFVKLSSLSYHGADIVPALVERNISAYTSENIRFFIADVIRDDLPKVDLILSRDCFVHLSDKHVLRAIENIKRSNSGLLLTTTFPEHQNSNIVTGSWRPINLEREPFSFPVPLSLINEGFHTGEIGDKSLGLWRISDLP